jgi:hypothetical protein
MTTKQTTEKEARRHNSGFVKKRVINETNNRKASFQNLKTKNVENGVLIKTKIDILVINKQ